MKRNPNNKIIPNRGLMSDPDEIWTHEQEEKEAGLQRNILSVLALLPIAAAAGLLLVGGLLYYGNELPPYGMYIGHADSTGYRPPPRTTFGAEGAVPRTGVEREYPDGDGGTVPPAAAAAVNPLPANEATLLRGGVAYANNCAFCHGTDGSAKVPVAESYVPTPPPLNTARVRGQAPGVLFHQITNGILSTPNEQTERLLPREWHAFKGTIPTDDRWAIVAFMKSIGRGPAAPGPEKTTYPVKPKNVMPGPAAGAE